MKALKIKLFSSLIGGVVLTTLGLFLFIQHFNTTTANFIISIGLINYAIALVLLVVYVIQLNKKVAPIR